jgi:hypothetical protein
MIQGNSASDFSEPGTAAPATVTQFTRVVEVEIILSVQKWLDKRMEPSINAG